MELVSNEVLYTWTRAERLAYYKELGHIEPNPDHAPTPDQKASDGSWCACLRGVFVDGWCSACGSSTDNRYIGNVDVWIEPESGYLSTENLPRAGNYQPPANTLENISKGGLPARVSGRQAGRPKVSEAQKRKVRRDKQRAYRSRQRGW